MPEPLSPAAIPTEELAHLRRRTLWVLFAGVALGSTGYIAAITVGTLVAAELGGTAALGGLPTASSVLGTASATAALSALMLRFGRRPGLVAGLGIGAAGAVLAVLAAIAGSIPLLVVGSFLAGFGNGAAQLSRYVAADLMPPQRRASAIGLMVWGATIGAVAGPNLVAPAGVVAEALGLPTLAGAYLVMMTLAIVALAVSFALLRPEPYRLAHADAITEHAADVPSATPARELLRRPNVSVAIAAMLAGQVVMVLIMTMTPIHMRDHGHGLDSVGIVLSAHMLGMFALSPISGRLTDRFGSVPVIGSGLGVLAVAALLAALAPPDGGPLLTLALFLLGFGWNLGFVAGSALLTTGLSLGDRTRIQGVADPLVWTSAAIASLSSGFVVAGAGYTTLGLIGAILLVGPFVLLAVRGRQLRLAAG